MGEPVRRLLGVILMLALLGVTVACTARPTGDFGRARAGVLHDEVMPTIGRVRAEQAGEPVSRFNWSDEEREMHDRVWRFLVAAHARDWFYDTAVELQRTRLTGATDHRFTRDRYYRWLHRTAFRSSPVRYRAMADHLAADIATAPATFAAICTVLAMDGQRQAASAALGGLASSQAEARRLENRRQIDWFVRALRYRYDSYSFALDLLLVETPHEEARAVDAKLSALAVFVERAERHDFCDDATTSAAAAGAAPLRGRTLMSGPPEAGLRK